MSPNTSQMTDPAMWQHANPGILLNCFTEHNPPEDEEEDPEYVMAMLLAMDPYDARLKPISEDKPINISNNIQRPSWNVRLHGDPDEF